MNDTTVLVTGISGFIAKHCAVEMLRHGYRVRGTVRSRDKADAVRATLAAHADTSRLDFVVADLLSDAGWKEATAGVHGVLHLASPSRSPSPGTSRNSSGPRSTAHCGSFARRRKPA